MKQSILYKLGAIILTGFFASSAIAKNYPHTFTARLTDSAVPSIYLNEQGFFLGLYSKIDNSLFNGFYAEDRAVPDLSTIEEDYKLNGNHKKMLVRLIRVLKTKQNLHNRRIAVRFFNDLAKVSARAKSYPLAMESYFHAMVPEIEPWPMAQNIDSVPTDHEDDTCENKMVANTWETPDAVFMKILPNVDTADIQSVSKKVIDSPPTSVTDIFDSFNDHKPAENYALIIAVKQPLPGKRKPFTGIGNVGHVFVILIKYNSDQTVVSRSFGFYPEKNSSFVATPIHPGSRSVFKDDALHDWDELAGKFISRKRFEKILRLLGAYEKKPYNLNQNNCSDFGLSVAAIGGIDIPFTNSKWPLGRGNNPANVGQSILEKKIKNLDTGNISGLFICSSKGLDE